MQMRCKLRVTVTRPQEGGDARIGLTLVTDKGEVVVQGLGKDIGFGCSTQFGPVWVEVKLSDISTEIFKEG